jgi:hypothetical protein
MPIRLTDLIARVPAEVEEKVRRVRDQTRAVLQEALRAECRLVMRTTQEAEEKKLGAQVPVEVAPGYPAILAGVSFPDDFEIIMLLSPYRASLERAHKGAKQLLRLREELSHRENPERWIQASEAELHSTSDWAAYLLAFLEKHDPLKTLLAVRDDFLGVYEYDIRAIHADEYTANRATIYLYWGVIGLVAEWMGCAVEDLAIVVLTHELAHAYTQLGADIEGRRWFAPQFAKTEKELKEGLAQYYTDRVLRRVERRYPGALSVFIAMLPGQPAAYRTHEPWIQDLSPEAVRRAMLEVRRWREGKVADFDRRLAAAQAELHPRRTQN